MSKRPPPAADGASGPREADARSSDVLYPHLAPPAEPDDDEEAAGRTRSIEQLDAETGALIKRWPTIAAAARGLGIHASKVGQNRTAGGFRWRDNSREVIEQLDAQTAKVVGRWPTRGARGSALLCGGVRWCVVRAGGSGSGGSGLQRGGGGERCGGRRQREGQSCQGMWASLRRRSRGRAPRQPWGATERVPIEAARRENAVYAVGTRPTALREPESVREPKPPFECSARRVCIHEIPSACAATTAQHRLEKSARMPRSTLRSHCLSSRRRAVVFLFCFRGCFARRVRTSRRRSRLRYVPQQRS